MDREGNPKSLKIEDIEGFRNLKNAKRFAIDIGGTLTKIAYYSKISQRIINYDSEEDKFDTMEGARLHFVKFETKYIASCLDFVRQNLVGSRDLMAGKKIKATGGGAYRYADLLQEKLGLSVEKEDEMGCLIKGCNFLLKNISDEAFIYHRHGDPEYDFQLADPDIFPYLLVNIGSGVSIMKVESEDKYERIGGTATGGGTFWGLGSLLTKAKGFDELLELAEQGDHRHADMLVRDIYGGDYQTLGLPGDLIASSFGKVCPKRGDQGQQCSEADVARSLLFTISNDIGQIACLYAMMHKLNRVYFGGYFLRNHPLSMHTISFAINFWSRGSVQCRFLRHEGYLGAIGAFLKGAEEWDEDKYSWLENYAGSSGLRTQASVMLESSVPVDQLELDRWQTTLSFCPLLADPANYVPDTVDLNGDQEAREYWLDCFENSIGKYVQKAVESQPESKTAAARGQQLMDKYLARLRHLKEQPFAYGNLTVRSLLDTIEHCLKEFDFPDPYLAQKQVENECALALLPARLTQLDEMPDSERGVELITALLAGNMFDWGAKEVVDFMEKGNFGFKEAREKIPERPWLVDTLDQWMERWRGPPHKCAAIFIDNSGIDFVLGVLPFARELLKRGTKVILCANSAPALNDVTHSELLVLIRQVSAMCDVVSGAVAEGRLVAMETAQAGPCLDLSKLDRDLVNALVHVDLLVLEGMGRAVHTNLDTKFTCESLRLAVIKNRWLANRLGGPMFSVICKYETPSA
ncbi:4'-phosphopantetheine phosphatase isoform X2 [Macrosteles quadrilineatus]|uniref:4'-phosphopantetheine phosphatase isoform X2 n=1 Tax=Macrosteles quadrilineatus TaxID=74068 RepID=UPI0023E32188|nr:4'-phosphopantetheine phosphatase isoform X2 [Macrosteles quadrilineatus]